MVLFLTPFFIKSQDLSGWNSSQINLCNTAKNSSILTEEEKKVILLINLARLDGEMFTTNIVLPFLKDKGENNYTKSLISDLKSVKNYPILEFKQELYSIAKKHAETTGKSGEIGHENFKTRVEPIRNKYIGIFENCDYGYNDALNIVLRLLIDTGTSSLGHRKALLNPNVYFVGVAIQPHKKWEYNCVQILTGKEL